MTDLVVCCLAPQWNLAWVSVQKGHGNMASAKTYTRLLCLDTLGPLDMDLFKLKQIASYS